MCVWYKVIVLFHRFIFFPLGDRLAILFKLDAFVGQICFMKGSFLKLFFVLIRKVCVNNRSEEK